MSRIREKDLGAVVAEFKEEVGLRIEDAVENGNQTGQNTRSLEGNLLSLDIRNGDNGQKSIIMTQRPNGHEQIGLMAQHRTAGRIDGTFSPFGDRAREIQGALLYLTRKTGANVTKDDIHTGPPDHHRTQNTLALVLGIEKKPILSRLPIIRRRVNNGHDTDFGATAVSQGVPLTDQESERLWNAMKGET